MRVAEVRNLLESFGPKGLVLIVRDLLEGRQIPNGQKLKLKPEQFSLRALWEGTVGPCEETLPSSRDRNIFAELEEQVNSTMFSVLSRLVLAQKVIDAYETQPGIGDQLITVMNSERKLENIAGFLDLEGLEDVAEGELYKDSSIAARYVTSEASKRGRLLSITEEAIREDRTGQLLMIAGKWGEMAKDDREQTIINGILDVDNKVFKPSGAATPLYAVGNLNLIGDGATPGGAPFNAPIALEDWTDIQLILQYHSQHLKTLRPKVGTGRPITWNPTQLLVPAALEATALSIVNATEIRQGVFAVGGAGMERTFRNPIANRFNVLTSPYIQNSMADWYLGDFKKQFIWHEVIPVQVSKQDASGPEAFERDVLARFKVKYFAGINALDTPYAVKVKGA